MQTQQVVERSNQTPDKLILNGGFKEILNKALNHLSSIEMSVKFMGEDCRDLLLQKNASLWSSRLLS
ncbi:hypothetical protein A3E89_02070 [Candidatus Campbellbacteria bacterium RIFCSPHIGHO2_12_FULL_35_10]|uniref:Uncharacterized protein n=1 Tax=Candidatus Campbellbacteria bacterium RIFCSPHIGHO2_12_FULL_35_10 TaxID=1797578 RepID=A0A1F5EPA7_9BACT|nr:MAG: hypothetical protein A3E89_02070 [Candidatus Campbellbacteria bacterium RIFCSPHIGHO2_12_FULL_35_10]